MNSALIFALALCSLPGPSQICVLEGRPPVLYPSAEACEVRKAVVEANGSIAHCVSRAPEWAPVD